MMTDEMLMAYADGALQGESLQQVARAVAADPALAARLAVFVQSRKAVAEALGGFAPAPVPDPLVAHIRALAAAREAQEKVVPFAPRAPRRVPFWQLPLAASVALAVGLVGGQMIRGSGPVGDLAGGLMASAPDLQAALSGLPSGARQKLESGAEVALIASFEDSAGALCREFELDQAGGATTVAVACRTGAEEIWDLQLAIAADAGAEGYAPASSLEALDAWLSATGAGAPLDPEAEAAALGSR